MSKLFVWAQNFKGPQNPELFLKNEFPNWLKIGPRNCNLSRLKLGFQGPLGGGIFPNNL